MRLLEIERDIAALLEINEVGQLLLSVEPRGSPDIDGIIAAVSDPARFKNAAAFAAYVGVVPGLKQSGKNGSRRAACIHGQCSPVQGAVYAGRGRTPAQCLAQAVL